MEAGGRLCHHWGRRKRRPYTTFSAVGALLAGGPESKDQQSLEDVLAAVYLKPPKSRRTWLVALGRLDGLGRLAKQDGNMEDAERKMLTPALFAILPFWARVDNI